MKQVKKVIKGSCLKKHMLALLHIFFKIYLILIEE